MKGGGISMDTNILLESGTNELEVLEFTLGDNHYGINVAKIREILQYTPVTPVPNSHPSVEGIFMPRDTMITVINLKKCLDIPDNDEPGLFIITNFNYPHLICLLTIKSYCYPTCFFTFSTSY